MKYFVVAGEASGDLHGANLVKALLDKDNDAIITGWGGDQMAAAGATVLIHYRELAFMGFVQVALHIRTILRNFKLCKRQIQAFQPDALILIDYPGFNLRMARWAKASGYRVVYYISPQIWAWHSSRAHQIKANVDQMLVILPFEQQFYQQYNYEVQFVGHPLLDVVNDLEAPSDFRQRHGLSASLPVIALLPGSRKQEVRIALRIMLEVASRFPGHQFAIAGAPSIPEAFYHSILKDFAFAKNVTLISGATYELLSVARAALVTSGTATLETALFEVPQVVCYKGAALSYWIARRLVQVKYISLVNLILDRPLLTELIQQDFNATKTEEALRAILENGEEDIREGYRQLRQMLGRPGASTRAAACIVEAMRASL